MQAWPTSAGIASRCGVLAAMVLVASGALADEPGTGEPEGSAMPTVADEGMVGAFGEEFSVELTIVGSRPGLDFTVVSVFSEEDGEETVQLVDACRQRCRLQMPPGAYRLLVRGPPGSDVVSGSSLDFQVSPPDDRPVTRFERSAAAATWERGRFWDDATLTVTPASRSRRVVGASVSVFGQAMIVLGGTLVTTSLLSMLPAFGCYEGLCQRTGPSVLAVGAPILAVGVVVTPVGLGILWSRTHGRVHDRTTGASRRL